MKNLILKENTQGTDWVVADIHGCKQKLLDKLDKVGFDFVNDRLLCSGDLVDRGPDSKGVVDLLDEPWFFSTLGNHEIMCMDAYQFDYKQNIYFQNGGSWFFTLTAEEQDEVIEKIVGLPLTIQTVVTGKKILLIHARVPEDDGDSPYLKENVEVGTIPYEWAMDAVWNRHFSIDHRDYRQWKTEAVKGFDLVCVGHTVLSKPTRMHNYLNLDIGIVYDQTKDFVFYNTKTEEIV